MKRLFLVTALVILLTCGELPATASQSRPSVPDMLAPMSTR
jgi:hypothetical protein